jgi:hypothetical protein
MKKSVSYPHVIYGACWVPVFFGEIWQNAKFYLFIYLFTIKLFSSEKKSNISPQKNLATIGLSF